MSCWGEAILCWGDEILCWGEAILCWSILTSFASAFIPQPTAQDRCPGPCYSLARTHPDHEIHPSTENGMKTDGRQHIVEARYLGSFSEAGADDAPLC